MFTKNYPFHIIICKDPLGWLTSLRAPRDRDPHDKTETIKLEQLNNGIHTTQVMH